MTHEDQWFKRQSIVVNKLGSIIKKMTTSAGIVGEKKFTNHSARKHLFQTKRKQHICQPDYANHRTQKYPVH